MLKNWTIISILTGIGTGALSLLFYPNYKFGIIVFLFVTIIMVLSNPKRRFMKAFWAVLSIFIGLNKFTLLVTGNILGIDFNYNSSAPNWIISLALLLLAVILLFFDYLENTERKFKLLGLININVTKTKKGNTNIITGGTYILVQGNYIVSDGKRQDINEIEEVKALIKREKELQILIANSMDNPEQLNLYQNELKNLREQTRQTKEEIIRLSEQINLLSKEYPEEVKQASEFLLSGHYGSAKDYFMDVQEERRDKKLAKAIGITYDELLQLDHEIEEGHSSRDGMIYYYNIWFSEDSPQEIIDKIEGVEIISDKYCLEVSPGFFDESDDYIDERE